MDTMRRLRTGRLAFDVWRLRGAAASTFGTRGKQYTNLLQSTSRKRKEMADLIVILTTMPNDERADALARTLVDERLAACVHVQAPISSTYRWKDAVECETERPLVIKTTRARLQDLETRLRALHPYDLPEFVVLSAEAGEAYGRWVSGAVGS
jgi:periplasmic divalent cation tolerance protein